MRRNVRSILPFVVEIVKPRLCVDGSCLGTVGPKSKPPCVLDTVGGAIQRLERGMLLTKTDDRYFISRGLTIRVSAGTGSCTPTSPQRARKAPISALAASCLCAKVSRQPVILPL